METRSGAGGVDDGAGQALDGANMERRTLAQHTKPVYCVAFSEHEPLLASAEWAAAPDADQGWYLKEPSAYEKAAKKSGRTAFFAEAFKPVTVTACQREKQGAVCGFVYFPCSEENGCTAVMNGSF